MAVKRLSFLSLNEVCSIKFYNPIFLFMIAGIQQFTIDILVFFFR